MSQIDLEKVFSRFREKFPPALDPIEAELKLSSQSIFETFCEIHPFDDLTIEKVIEFLDREGYVCEPEEYNERITFKWLLKKS